MIKIGIVKCLFRVNLYLFDFLYIFYPDRLQKDVLASVLKALCIVLSVNGSDLDYQLTKQFMLTSLGEISFSDHPKNQKLLKLLINCQHSPVDLMGYLL